MQSFSAVNGNDPDAQMGSVSAAQPKSLTNFPKSTKQNVMSAFNEEMSSSDQAALASKGPQWREDQEALQNTQQTNGKSPLGHHEGNSNGNPDNQPKTDKIRFSDRLPNGHYSIGNKIKSGKPSPGSGRKKSSVIKKLNLIAQNFEKNVEFATSRLRKWMESDDPDISLRALSLVMKYGRPVPTASQTAPGAVTVNVMSVNQDGRGIEAARAVMRKRLDNARTVDVTPQPADSPNVAQ